jgi:hypothetical protein
MSATAWSSCSRAAVKKSILVVARSNKVEALRVAAGLTLLDDAVRLAVLGGLEETPAVREQLDVLEFAEVPMQRYDASTDAALARDMLGADVVYVL